MRLAATLAVLVAGAAPAAAQSERAQPEVERAQGEGDQGEGEVIVIVDTRSREAVIHDHRAVSVVEEQELEDRAVRTVSDALVYAPGVSVQKTNHAGGSPYIRGVTGQQTLVLVDGFRLNTSIMRSGPNQYLNTIDAWSVERIEVLRGAGSVLYGSDAIGGVIDVTRRRPDAAGHRARGVLRAASAERSLGGRLEYEGASGGVAYSGGIGASRFGNLRSAGPPPLTQEPVYDGDEQLFTAYDEVAGDAKAIVPVGPGLLTTAALVYRQSDAARTDKCDPGPPLDCRFFDEQNYDLAYVKYRADLGRVAELDVGLAVARTHERRSRVREERDVINRELDEVLTIALTGRASTRPWTFGDAGIARWSYGADVYADWLSSEAVDEVMSSGMMAARARGKYLDGSRYLSAAAFGFGELAADETTSFTAGARVNAVRARVASDPGGGTPAFADWLVHPVFSAGVRMKLGGPIYAVASADQGFRAPNLDDLTAESSEGPGYQIANADLDPEKSITLEAGLQVRHPRLWVTGFVYATFIDDFIARRAIACPSSRVAECGDADAVFELVNAESAMIRGVEAAARAVLDGGVSLMASATWTKGDKQVSVEPADAREPLSKLPPVHGVALVRFDFLRRYFVETGARWALAQDRLSPADLADARIPPGGTPAYGVVDLRAGARVSDSLRATLAVENLANSRYRVHGSGVDGAGFNVVLGLTGTIGGR